MNFIDAENVPMHNSGEPKAAAPKIQTPSLTDLMGISGAQSQPEFELSVYDLPVNGVPIIYFMCSWELANDVGGALTGEIKVGFTCAARQRESDLQAGPLSGHHFVQWYQFGALQKPQVQRCE